MRLLLLLVVTLAWTANRAWPADRNFGAVVLVDSRSPAYTEFREFIQLYLDHLDFPYEVWDVARREITPEVGQASLLIFGHNNVRTGAVAAATLVRAAEAGLGIVSFDAEADGGFPLRISRLTSTSDQAVTVRSNQHYITNRKETGQQIRFRGQFPLAEYEAVPAGFEILASIGTKPFVIAGRLGKGRVVAFSSYAWLDPERLGFFAGLDDLVWRSFVWAARKPFVMQGMPSIVSMRVDDCSGGTNRDWAYVEAVNRLGIVPHCTFMLDEITDSCARKMAQLVNAGRMQVSVHARKSAMKREAFFWWDHQNNRAFDDETMEKNYRDARQFFDRYSLKHANSINIHYEEMGENTKPYLKKLGVEFVVSWTAFGMPVHRQDQFHAAPYLKFRPAGHWLVAPSSATAGHLAYNPRAVMDWLDADHSFFDNYVDPIDIKYDWLRKCELPPYRGTFADSGMILDGVAMLRRELDSMFPAYYFTHEVNINRYSTEQLGTLMRGVWNQLSRYNPEPVSYDDLNRYARAQFTSKLERVSYDPARDRITVRLTGSADVATRLWVYTGEGQKVSERMERVPPFARSVEVTMKANP